MSKYNFALHRAIKEKGITARDLSGLVGDSETIISKIVNGKYPVSDLRKIAYAKALRKKVSDLFD